MGRREIKFRAWKPRNSLRMKPGIYQVSDIVWYDKPFQGNTGEVFYKGYRTRDYLEDIELMQYTGLKDKNGKEIYESDHVTCEGFGGTYEIVWRGCGFWGQHLESENIGDVDLEMQELTVVGNKYEN